MVPDHYVWLVWSSLFLVPWVILYAAFPRLRAAMMWTSLFTLPFGFCEPLFVGRYWNPPSLFNLARTMHLDLETFVYCFGIGGVAAVLSNVVTGRPVAERRKTYRDLELQAYFNIALATPALAFGIVLVLGREPIDAGIAAMAVGAGTRVVGRPDLLAKTGIGGLLFLGYYGGFLLVLRGIAPGYLERVWNPSGPAAAKVFGLPWIELLFAASFGMYWSGLYEQFRWTLAWPEHQGP